VAYDFAADTLAKELRSAGHEVRVAIPSGDDIWYRVRITGLSSRAEAKALALRLSAGKYPGAWVPPAPYPGP
jgi:cell division protein FtsN